MAIFLIYITYSMNTVTSEFVKYDFDFIFSMFGVIKQILLLPMFTSSNSFLSIGNIPFEFTVIPIFGSLPLNVTRYAALMVLGSESPLGP